MNRNAWAPALALLSTLLAASQASADECPSQFTESGSPLSGKLYRSETVLPGVAPADAYSRMLRYVSQNGFTVVQQSPDQGLFEAAHAAQLAKGTRMPMNVAVTQHAQGTLVSMSFALKPLMIHQVSGVKDHFCKTLAAAAAGTPASPTAAAPVPAQPEATVNASAVPQRPTLRGAAPISPSQQQLVHAAVHKGPHPEPIKAALAELLPVITQFVERTACINKFDGVSSLDEFAASGSSFKHSWPRMPMRAMNYHDRSQCLEVLRVHGWTMPADNALQFEVAYKAADSGEAAKTQHEMLRQPDGSWLFRR